MSCDAERVTAYVDGALDAAARAEAEAHLASCPACREQAEAERGLRERLKGLPAVEPPPALEQRIRQRLRRAAPGPARWLLPLAAGLAILALWTRGAAPIVAWELSRDHSHCFSFARLPAQVLSQDPVRVTAWFEDHGARLPVLPAAVGKLELVGGRLCPLPDGSKAAHLYYCSDNRQVSVFVLAHGVRLDGGYAAKTHGNVVQLVRLGDTVVGIVSERRQEVDSFHAALTTTMARLLTRPARLVTMPVPPVGL